MHPYKNITYTSVKSKSKLDNSTLTRQKKYWKYVLTSQCHCHWCCSQSLWLYNCRN